MDSERPPKGWGFTFKLLGTIAGLGLIVLVIVWVVLVKTGHLAT